MHWTITAVNIVYEASVLLTICLRQPFYKLGFRNIEKSLNSHNDYSSLNWFEAFYLLAWVYLICHVRWVDRFLF